MKTKSKFCCNIRLLMFAFLFKLFERYASSVIIQVKKIKSNNVCGFLRFYPVLIMYTQSSQKKGGELKIDRVFFNVRLEHLSRFITGMVTTLLLRDCSLQEYLGACLVNSYTHVLITHKATIQGSSICPTCCISITKSRSNKKYK